VDRRPLRLTAWAARSGEEPLLLQFIDEFRLAAHEEVPLERPDDVVARLHEERFERLARRVARGALEAPDARQEALSPRVPVVPPEAPREEVALGPAVRRPLHEFDARLSRRSKVELHDARFLFQDACERHEARAKQDSCRADSTARGDLPDVAR